MKNKEQKNKLTFGFAFQFSSSFIIHHSSFIIHYSLFVFPAINILHSFF